LGWSKSPGAAQETTQTLDRSRILLRHANYHPDGGQLFFPMEAGPFVAPLTIRAILDALTQNAYDVNRSDPSGSDQSFIN